MRDKEADKLKQQLELIRQRTTILSDKDYVATIQNSQNMKEVDENNDIEEAEYKKKIREREKNIR
jgi:hypothetical protein